MKLKILPFLLAASAALFLALPFAIAQNAKPKDPLTALAKPKVGEAEAVTVITSDRLFYDYKQKFALFQTNVVVTDPRIQIKAEQMTVFFDESNHVSAIKCERNVRISQEDKTAKSELATYDVRSGDIILTGGKPEVVSGNNFMTGDPMIFNRDNNTINVPGTVERPRIRFMPGSGGLESGGKTPAGKEKAGGK